MSAGAPRRIRAGGSGRVGAYSTAAVLWLMILLVFLPIALGHVLATIFAPAG